MDEIILSFHFPDVVGFGRGGGGGRGGGRGGRGGFRGGRGGGRGLYLIGVCVL